MQRVNYDEIAHLYDSPDRQHDVDPNLSTFLDECEDLDASSISILDVGCGTGQQVAANRSAFPDALLVGSDLFQGMLRVAADREPEALWAQSDGSCLGFLDNTFDYVSNQFSYAHIQNKPAFSTAVFRILKPKGRFVITSIDPWSMDRWIMYRYFPAARSLDHADFLRPGQFEKVLTDAGFENIKVSLAHQDKKERLGDFLAYASERHRASHFMAMSDADYEAGLYALTEAVEDEGPDATVDSESCLLTLSADKPGD
jgi:SAM-dependent methyltransferase